MNENGHITSRYQVSISFESIGLPPFKDILVLAKKCPIGIQGVSRCMGLIAPDNFSVVEVEHEIVEAVLIHRRFIKRLPTKTIVSILNERVFPFISIGETVRIDFNLKIVIEGIEGVLERHL